LPKLGRRACDKCHKVDGKNAAYVPPNHGDCAGCHTPTHAVPMASCGSCHNMGSADGSVTQCSPTVPWRSRQIAKRFSHDSHRTDIRKPGSPPLDCGFCHWGVHRSKSVRKMKLMHGFKTMERACGPCHNGRLRVPGSKRRVFSTTGDCRKCHGNKFSSGAGVPTGH
jgi:c(7)-type cytochrome triheme protein